MDLRFHFSDRVDASRLYYGELRDHLASADAELPGRLLAPALGNGSVKGVEPGEPRAAEHTRCLRDREAPRGVRNAVVKTDLDRFRGRFCLC